MTEVIISFAAKVSEYLVNPILREGSYLFCVCKILKSLENEKGKLTSARDDVSQRVKDVEKKTERIEDAVQKWLQEVQNLLEEVENLEQKVKANSCFRELCPTWRRYRLCKQLANKIAKFIELTNNSKFERFSRLASLPTIEYFPSGSFTLFESTKLAYDQLLEALRDDSCYMIVLHGMGGCGKTTLVKEVGKRAKELNLFDKFVFATVSQTPNIRNIQGEIADLLGLTLTEESEPGRARRLSLRLQGQERILVILDDVWEKLKLEDIGIPLDGNLKGCKVLLTTRLQQLCSLMECQRNVLLGLLSEEEAWILFQKHAGIVDETSSSLLNIVAQEVAMECKGLPIAIEAVGTSLKGKPLDNWKDALNRLRHSKPVGVEEGVRDAFTCLQYSYDHLKSEEAKGLFLICSMFPEDHEISMESLFRYAIGLGLCGEADSFDKTRSQVNAALNHLLDSSLLMPSERKENHLKMHDMVRDVALFIASKMNHTIMVDHAKGLNSLASDGAIKNCFAVSTWYKEEDQFPQQLDSPKVEILLLNSYHNFDFSHASFEGMKGLKVMAIISLYPFHSWLGVSLPQSTQWLTNFKTLRLIGCKLGDISFVVSLRQLEILDLQGSSFKVLPNGIEKLKKLKLLDLSNCNIDDCHDEVIGRCSMLEELYVYSNEAYSGAKVIDSYQHFLENVTFPKLQRYILQIGQFTGFIRYRHSSMRVLLLGELNISTSGAIIKDLLQRAEEVGLESLQGGCRSIIPGFVEAVGSMNQLTKIWLRTCSEIEFLICTTTAHPNGFQVVHLFPMLVELRLEFMDNLIELCDGPPPLHIFQKLKEVSIFNCCQLIGIFPQECNLSNLKDLSIINCPKLTSLFPMTVARTLLQLEYITVEDCSELRQIIMNGGQSSTDPGKELVTVSESPGFMFPKLKYLRVRHCDKIQSLLPISFAQGPIQLQRIQIENASELNNVFGKHEELRLQNCQQMMKGIFLGEWNLGNLKTLIIKHFPNLTSLFSVSVAQTLQLLEELIVEKCRELKCIIYNGEEDGIAASEKNFPVSDNSLLMFSKLRILIVYDCDKLEYICPIYCAQGLVQLQQIRITSAPQLKYVFGRHASEDLSINCNEIQVMFPQLKEFKLLNLPSLDKICPGNYYPVWPSLNNLIWTDCPKLTTSCGNINVGLELAKLHSSMEITTNECKGSNEALAPMPTTSNVELEELQIKYCGVAKIFHLEEVVLRNDQQELITSNLKSLVLKNLPELSSTWTDINLTQVLSLGYLRYVTLDQCGKLQCLFPKVIHRSLPHLTSLLICNCEELEEIFAENEEHQNLSNVQESFPKLEKLKVEGCTKLKIIFSVRTARTFPQLRSLCISEAAELKEVFGHTSEDSSGNEREIMLPKLRKIKLQKLPSLIDICQGFNLLAEELRKIQIHECPKFAPISEATRYWRTKGLRIVFVNGSQLSNGFPTLPLTVLYLEELDDCGVIDMFHIDGPVSLDDDDHQQLMDSKVVSLGSEHELWRGPIPTKMLSLQYLHRLVVRRCGKLKSLFHVNVVHKSLPELAFLTVSDCEELEEIIAEEREGDHNLSNAQLSLCFPRLRELVVKRCNKLKTLFPSTIAKKFPQLEILRISNAAQLKQVFCHKSEGSSITNNDGEKIVLTSLRKLTLWYLPSLVGLRDEVEVPNLIESDIWECPNSGFDTINWIELESDYHTE